LKSLNKNDIVRLKELLEKSENILVTTHHNSDGDAIGSSLGLALVLKKAGKKVNIVTPNEYPHFLKWMPGSELITVFKGREDAVKKMVDEADLLFCVDYNEPSRLKYAAKTVFSGKAPIVLIDHHPEPADFADVCISETDLGSASELVFHVVRELGMEKLVDKDVATALYAGIMTDTGCFSFSCSYPGVFEVVAQLIRHGIPKDEIHSRIYDNYSDARMRLMGFCLNEKMIILPEYKTAYISLSQEEADRFDHVPGDTEGFVNLPFSIKGIVLTAFFMEKKDHVKISFRSRGSFSVTELAKTNFRGGGHMNAAGAEWDLPLEKTIQRFLDILPKYADKLK
jgi:bifunctional oligoribonuclease and PAP phosphatase NrnA